MGTWGGVGSKFDQLIFSIFDLKRKILGGRAIFFYGLEGGCKLPQNREKKTFPGPIRRFSVNEKPTSSSVSEILRCSHTQIDRHLVTFI